MADDIIDPASLCSLCNIGRNSGRKTSCWASWANRIQQVESSPVESEKKRWPNFGGCFFCWNCLPFANQIHWCFPIKDMDSQEFLSNRDQNVWFLCKFRGFFIGKDMGSRYEKTWHVLKSQHTSLPKCCAQKMGTNMEQTHYSSQDFQRWNWLSGISASNPITNSGSLNSPHLFILFCFFNTWFISSQQLLEIPWHLSFFHLEISRVSPWKQSPSLHRKFRKKSRRHRKNLAIRLWRVPWRRFQDGEGISIKVTSPTKKTVMMHPGEKKKTRSTWFFGCCQIYYCSLGWATLDRKCIWKYDVDIR